MATGLCFTVAVATHENNGLWSLKYWANHWWHKDSASEWSSVALFTKKQKPNSAAPSSVQRRAFSSSLPSSWVMFCTITSWVFLTYKHVTVKNQSRLLDIWNTSYVVCLSRLEHHGWSAIDEHSVSKDDTKPFRTTTENILNTMDLLVCLMFSLACWFGVVISTERPVWSLHFLPSRVWGGRRKWKSWCGVWVRDCTRFVEVGNLSFTSLPACRASPCTLNNVPSVPATTVTAIVFHTAKFRNGDFLSSPVSISLNLSW